MATLKQGVQPPTPSLLLELPGEIRNRIYNIVLSLTPRKVALLPHLHKGNCLHCPQCRNGVSWPTLRRSALGLTQTCRQLRAEFLPLHQKTSEISIRSGPTVEKYISDFFPVLAKANGSLTVAIRYGKTDLDLTPLMRVACAAPGFKFALQYMFSDWACAGTLRVVVNVLNNETWKKYFDKAVMKMSYSEMGFKPRFSIEVRAAAVEEWMPWSPGVNRTPDWTGTKWEARPHNKKEMQAAEDWRCRVGLGYPELSVQQIVVKEGLLDIGWESAGWRRALQVCDKLNDEL